MVTPVLPPTVTAENIASAVTVRLFAGAEKATGTRSVVIAIERPLPVADVLDRACVIVPALDQLRGKTLFGVNGEYTRLDFLLKPGDELVLVPAGGSAGP